MYQLGIGISSIAGTKSYMELDIAKLPQLAGTWKQMLVTIVIMPVTQVCITSWYSNDNIMGLFAKWTSEKNDFLNTNAKE